MYYNFLIFFFLLPFLGVHGEEASCSVRLSHGFHKVICGHLTAGSPTLEELLRRPVQNLDSRNTLNLLEHVSTVQKITVFGDGFTVSENALSPFTELFHVVIEKRGNANARPIIHQNAFSRLSKIEDLVLDTVQLPSDTSRMFNPFVSKLNQLEVKNVDMSRHVNSFKECTQLQRVTMTNCELTEFPIEMLRKSATNMRKINFSKNKITTPLKADNLGIMTELQSLDLSCNKIPSVENNVFSPMHLIGEINLEFNQIRSMTAAMFQPCHFLREIKLKGNPITGLNRGDIRCAKFSVFTAPGGGEPITCGN